MNFIVIFLTFIYEFEESQEEKFCMNLLIPMRRFCLRDWFGWIAAWIFGSIQAAVWTFIKISCRNQQKNINVSISYQILRFHIRCGILQAETWSRNKEINTSNHFQLISYGFFCWLWQILLKFYINGQFNSFMNNIFAILFSNVYYFLYILVSVVF